MITAYWVCFIVGVTVPVLSLLCDFFDGVADLVDLDLDFPEIEIGDFHFALLPISSNSICGALLLFGTLGLVLSKSTSLPLWIINIIAIAAGYLGGILLQTLINKLKKIEHPAMKEEELILFDASVVNAIPAKGLGKISISIPNSSSISYPAKSMDGERIPQNKEVYIDRIEKGIAYVYPKDYLEQKYADRHSDQSLEQDVSQELAKVKKGKKTKPEK